MDIKSPKEIYLNVSAKVDAILKSLAASSDDGQVSKAKDSAREILGKFTFELNGHIAALERHAEWDTFTIAFYGETNAGKSTIIETLRILLAEQSKVEAQHEFKALQAKYGITEQRLEELRAAMAQGDQLCKELQTSQKDLHRKFEEQKNRLHGEISSLQRFIADKKQSASVWKKILNIFIKLPEEKQSAQLELARQAQDVESRREVELLQNKQFDAQRQKTAHEQEYQRAETEMQHLAGYADGAIIGNGRSDFTLATQGYQFASAGRKFALLDVPGIEGKEAKVMDNIWSAVQTAHAVFYVTGKAAPPQKGDDGRKGTLEKIQEHLGAQTEVWTIFNKRITNPLQLEKGDLISKDEQTSLDDLDRKMREQLGDNYRRAIFMSAQPAFLAVADCLVPGSQNANNKAKFMSKFSAQDLLVRSKAIDFHDLLTGDLVKDHKVKITKSNFNKANQVVKDASAKVAAILSTTFKPLGAQLKQDAVQAQSQLDIALAALKSRLESQGERAIDGFSNMLRQKIYSRIDDDIDNDDFKRAFERYIREEQEKLVQNLPFLMAQEVEKFQTQIADVIERFQEFASELLDAYGNIRVNGLDSRFDLKIDIDNGINLPGLLGALAGGVLMAWNPAGWVVLALGAVTVIVGAWKAVRSIFSSDYKKTQQRKSADANLETIIDNMRESMRNSLASALPQLEPKIEALKAAVEEPARQVTEINAILSKSEVELKRISQAMETVGAT